MRFRIWKTLVLGAALVAVAGCSTRRPVLYPNQKLNEVGHTVARRDIEDCKRVADGMGSRPRPVMLPQSPSSSFGRQRSDRLSKVVVARTP